MSDHDREVVEREIHHVHEPEPRRGRFLAGFLVAILLVVAAVVAFFVISDDDDDGRLDIDVPAVDVDVEE